MYKRRTIHLIRILTRIVDGLETVFTKLGGYNYGTTTFSGPIKAGTILNTTGTTLGDNVKNVGQVVMAQSSDVDLSRKQSQLTASNDAFCKQSNYQY